MVESDRFADPFSTSAAASNAQVPRFSEARPAEVAAVEKLRWPIRSQVIVLIFVVLASALFGWATFRVVAGVHLSAEGWAEVSAWSWGILAGAVATLVVVIVSIVALVRTQASRLLPVISLVTALFLPPIALYAGARLGFDYAAAAVSRDLYSITSNGMGSALMGWLLELAGG